MKYRTLISQLLVALYVVGSFGIAWISTDYWRRSGEDWAYWAGHISIALLSVFAGLGWVILKAIPYPSTVRVNRSRRMVQIVLGFFFAIMGVLLLINQWQQLRAGCPAPGCGISIHP